LPGSFDSAEPRWINHTVAMMKVANWRNSLCQFSMMREPKSEDARYRQKPTVAS
jgi:hypothetical protein